MGIDKRDVLNSKILFEEYFREVNNLVEVLSKYINSYRLLIGGAGELNSIALARKGDVKDALKRVNELGKLIDCLIKTLDGVQCCYIEYLKLKSTLIEIQTTKDIILTEIDQDLLFNNNTRFDCNDGHGRGKGFDGKDFKDKGGEKKK